MRRFWKIAGIATVVAVVAVIALGAVALAQDTEDGDSWPSQFREKLHEAIAGILGITVDEYDSAVDSATDQVLDEAVTEGWLTQDQADLMRERAEEGLLEGFGRGMRPGGHGGRGGMMDLDGSPRGFDGTQSTLLTLAAEQLGTTVEDLVTQLEDGETIASLAEEQGVDTQDIAEAYLENYSDKLDEAVVNERITQEQATSMLEQAAESVQERMNATWPDSLSHPDGMRDGVAPRGFDGTQSTLLTLAAEQLGTTVEDLVTQLEDGETIAGLAEAQGVDTQDIADAYLENYSDKLDEAVANGRITQEQATSMLEQAAESVQERMNATWPDCLSHPDGLRDGFMPHDRHGIEDEAEVEGTSS